MSYVYILNVQGTVEFIAPELISCKAATSSSDMWSDFYITYLILYTILDYNIYTFARFCKIPLTETYNFSNSTNIDCRKFRYM